MYVVSREFLLFASVFGKNVFFLKSNVFILFDVLIVEFESKS
jgi:hypothetical protein